MNQPLYEKRLDEDLKKIKSRITSLASDIEKGLKDALLGLIHFDSVLAYQTILGDNPINRDAQEIDKLCHYFVARHLPSAGHLRFISSVMRINIELERIGDYAVTICRETVQLSKPLTQGIQREIEFMARDAFQMFNQAVRAFNEQNAELARGTMIFEEGIDRSFNNIFDILVQKGEADAMPTMDLFSILAILNMLERVSDQSKNICEETVFSVTGQGKTRKPVRVLFLDKANDLLGPMAACIAKKAFPASGVFFSAGSEPAVELRPDFIKFMDEKGYEVEQAKPNQIHLAPEEWETFKVIISLKGSYQSYLKKVPFHSVALNWELPEPPAQDLPPDEKTRVFSEIHKHLSHEIHELMTTLRGEEAS